MKQVSRSSPHHSQLLERAFEEIYKYEISVWSKRKWLGAPPCEEELKLKQLLNQKGICQDSLCNQLIKSLIDKGYLVEYALEGRSCYRTVVTDLAFKMSDLRKLQTSYYRISYFDIVPCELPRADFSAVTKDVISQLLLLHGLPTWPAEWHESYSIEQAKIIENILRLLKSPEPGLLTIALDTGAGKTESFLIPSLAYASRGVNGTSVIIVYPRKSLEADQVKRIVSLYLRFALANPDKCKGNGNRLDCSNALPQLVIRDGESRRVLNGQVVDRDNRPVPPRLKEIAVSNVTINGVTYDCVSTNISYDKTSYNFNIKLKCRLKHSSSSLQVERQLEVIIPVSDVIDKLEQKQKPPIVMLNYDMLNRMLAGASKPPLHTLLPQDSNKIIVIFDEAHMYHGASFIGLIGLLARLTILLGNRLLLVLSSATLPNLQLFDKIIQETIKGAANTDNIAHYGPITLQPQQNNLRRRLLISIIQSEPHTQASWLFQLATLLSLLRLLVGQKQNRAKGLAFFDSISFISIVRRNFIQTLYNRTDLPEILKDHYILDPNNPLDWSPYIRRLAAQYGVNLNTQDWHQQLAEKIIQHKPASRIIAEHHAALEPLERQVIENAFRRQEDPLMLLATSTLEVGIDIPELSVIGLYRLPYTPQSLIQRIGRAARSSSTLYTANVFIILSNYPRDSIFVYDKNVRSTYFYPCVSEKDALQPKLRMPVNEAAIRQHYFLAILDILTRNNYQELVYKFVNGKIVNVSNSYQYIINMVSHLEQAINSLKADIENTLKRLANAFTHAYGVVQQLSNLLTNYTSLRTLLNNPTSFVNELLQYLQEVSKGAIQVYKQLLVDIEKISGTYEGRLEKYSNKLNNLFKEIMKLYKNLVQNPVTLSSTQGNQQVFSQLVQLIRRLTDYKKEISKIITEIVDDMSLPLSEPLELHSKLMELLKRIDELVDLINDTINVIDDIKAILSLLTSGSSQQLLSNLSNSLDELSNLLAEIQQTSTELYSELSNLLRLVRRSYQVFNTILSRPDPNMTTLDVLSRIFGISWMSLFIESPGRQVQIRIGVQKKIGERGVDPFIALIRLIPFSIRRG